jgi:predicted negative regulator of RcsB-dependent stress response
MVRGDKMDNYETEEQQVEAIKKWWSENYKMVIAALVIGLGGLIGIQQWKHMQVVEAYNASMDYDNVLSLAGAESEKPIAQQVDKILQDYAKYPYAALSALMAARQLADDGKLAEAETKYQWVIQNGQSQSLLHVARINLATVMSAQGNHEEALKILDVEQGSFKPSYLETRGDILVSLNRINDAKAAYDQALQAYAAIGANAQILKVKRNDLGNS